MKRRVKEFVEIDEHVSLEGLIDRLTEVRDGLPDECEAELRLRGDEIFGRRITVTYFREQTDEEAELEKRYAEASREAKEKELERLQAELGVVCYAAPGKRGKLRIVG
jgi:sensor histidine kinase YesM